MANWPKNGLLDPKAITDTSGLPLDYSAAHEAEGESWHFMPWDANVPRSAVGIIEGMWFEQYELVLETDRVRVIPADEAAGFWRKWWAAELERK